MKVYFFKNLFQNFIYLFTNFSLLLFVSHFLKTLLRNILFTL